jgi:hypothetical protein
VVHREKLILQLHVSVDGYFDGPNHELDWFVLDDEFFAYVDRMLASIDGTLPKFVASTTLNEASWSNTTIMADDVPNVVAGMKQEP